MRLNKHNFVIGITGGVGAGKSEVLSFLSTKYNAKIYKADEVQHELTDIDCQERKDVLRLFGAEILLKDGSLDRRRISEIVFSDNDKLKALNSIIHPGVRRLLEDRARTEDGYIILEAALPEEAGFFHICDEIWYIWAKDEVRISRLKNDRGYTEERINTIMNNQLSEEEFKKLSDRIIDNSSDFENTKKQIEEAMNEISNNCKWQ